MAHVYYVRQNTLSHNTISLSIPEVILEIWLIESKIVPNYSKIDRLGANATPMAHNHYIYHNTARCQLVLSYSEFNLSRTDSALEK